MILKGKKKIYLTHYFVKYAEFERRERERKSQKIRAVFEFVSDEEIEEALKDCENDEV